MKKSENKIDLSVVIATCNRYELLLEAIGSIDVSDDISIEIIVVDDSIEGTACGVVDAFPRLNVTYIKREVPSNRRPALVRNQGAENAKGEFIYFLDDDDTSCKGSLPRLISELRKNPGLTMAYGKVMPFGKNPEKLQANISYFNKATVRAKLLKGKYLFSAYHAFCPTTFVSGACLGRTTAFRMIGGFDASIPLSEDIDLWLRMGLVGGSRFIDFPVLNYRVGETSLMNNVSANDEKLVSSYKIIQSKYLSELGASRFIFLKIICKIFRKVTEHIR